MGPKQYVVVGFVGGDWAFCSSWQGPQPLGGIGWFLDVLSFAGWYVVRSVSFFVYVPTPDELAA